MSGNQRHRACSKFGLLPAGLSGCLLFAAGLVAMPQFALAQQWVVTPQLEIGGQYVENPRLRESGETPDPNDPDAPSDDDNVTGGLLDLGLALRRITPTSSVMFRPTAALFRYSGDSNEDSERYSADFDAQKEGQRSEWRFRANYDQQQVLRGETTSSDIDDDDIGIDDDDLQTGSGRTFERRQRDRWRIRPGFAFDLTQRTALEFEVNLLDVQYESQELGEAVDYTNTRVQTALVRELTPESSLSFLVFGTRYDPGIDRPETDSVGAGIRYERDITNISGFFAEVGGQEATVDPVDPLAEDITENSVLWNVGYDRRWERTRWRFQFGQAVTPSGSGGMVERDQYRVQMRHQFRPRWAMELSAVAMSVDALSSADVVTRSDRDYLQARASLVYEITRKWRFETRYTLTHQDFADIPGDGQEHAIRASFIYQPPVPTS
jgi:hypothetical protein